MSFRGKRDSRGWYLSSVELAVRQSRAYRCTYAIWQQMRARCRYEKHPFYQYYGGRGIKVCERWQTFENFFADMGERPEGKTLDRYPDNDGNYEPGNCRWVSRKEQARNRRTTSFVEYKGERQSLAALIERSGIHRSTVRKRLKLGWPIERALHP